MFGPVLEISAAKGTVPVMTGVYADAIEAFWLEWPQLRKDIEKELTARDYGSGTDRLTDLVEAIDPGLEWDLMPGIDARHALCLSAASDPALRPVTEQWVRGSPGRDSAWEYHPARIPVPAAAPLTVGEIRIQPQDVSVVIEPDQTREELNLTIGHPDFGALDEVLQLQVAFRLLDDLLGEDAMEVWIGSVDVVPHSLGWGVPLLDLPEAVGLLIASSTGRQWEYVDLDDPDLGESRLYINRALKRVDYLDFTLAVIVSIEIPSEDRVLVREVEKDLAATLGSEGVIYAHRVFGDFTVLYAYVGEEVSEEVRSLAERWTPNVYEIRVEPDAGWDVYEEMR